MTPSLTCSRLTVEHEEKQEDQEEQVDEDYKHITENRTRNKIQGRRVVQKYFALNFQIINSFFIAINVLYTSYYCLCFCS